MAREEGREGKERCCSWRRWNGEINLAKRDGRADVFHILLSHLFSFLARSLARSRRRIAYNPSQFRPPFLSLSVLILTESGGTRTTPAIVRTAISCVRATCITLLRASPDDDSGPRPPPTLLGSPTTTGCRTSRVFSKASTIHADETNHTDVCSRTCSLKQA